MRQTVIDKRWPRDSNPRYQMIDIPDEDGDDTPKTPRIWQRRMYLELQGRGSFGLNAPPGSGKTTAILLLVHDRLLADPSLRAIIAVPQTIIGAGFRRLNMLRPDGSQADCTPLIDLCDSSSRSNISQVCDFLSGDPGLKVEERILICSHSSLVMSFKDHPDLFRNMIIIIDEAHHCQGSDSKGPLEAPVSNGIGAVALHPFMHPELDIELGLVTATPFRGDRYQILPERFESDLYRFDLPYDEHLRSCKHLQGFTYDFHFCPGSYPEVLRGLFSEQDGKHTIVHIPNVMSRFSIGKEADVWAVLRGIAGCDEPEIEDLNAPVMRVRRGEEWVRVVNLVDNTIREEKKAAIICDNKKKKSEIDVIIALNMMKEGADWQHADRSFILGFRNSLTEMIQIIGRLLRDCPDKEMVVVHHLLPGSFDMEDSEEVREPLNDNLNAVLLSMMLEDVMFPILDFPREKGEKKAREGSSRSPDLIQEAFSKDGTKIVNFYADVQRGIVDIQADDPTLSGDVDRLFERFSEMVSEVLSSEGVSEYHQEIATRLWMGYRLRELRFKGMDPSLVDYDILSLNPFDFILSYGGEIVTKTWEDLRERLPRRYNFIPFEELMEIVREAGLRTNKEYEKWWQICGRRDVPNQPDVIYGDEWPGWPEFLGVKRIYGREMLSLEDLMDIVRAAGVKTNVEYQVWRMTCGRDDTPSGPDRYYKDWPGWTAFLGTERTLLSLEELMVLVRAAGLRTREEYGVWYGSCGRTDIPKHPHIHYKDAGWIGWPEFLGVERVQGRDMISLEDLTVLVRADRVRSQKGYLDWWRNCGRNDVPSSPQDYYEEDGWPGWPIFLGKEKVQGREMLSLEELMVLVRAEGLRSQKEYGAWWRSCERRDVPSHPDRYYKDDGWPGWRAFLGTERTFLSLEDLMILVRAEGVKTKDGYDVWWSTCGRNDIPGNPQTYYEDDWPGWRAFLGTERTLLSLEELMVLVRAEGVKTMRGYVKWHKTCGRNDTPLDPDRYYKDDGWPGWRAFLGTERIFLSLEDLMILVRTEGVKTKDGYWAWYKICGREDVPSSPRTVYNEWPGWPVFLGTDGS